MPAPHWQHQRRRQSARSDPPGSENPKTARYCAKAPGQHCPVTECAIRHREIVFCFSLKPCEHLAGDGSFRSYLPGIGYHRSRLHQFCSHQALHLLIRTLGPKPKFSPSLSGSLAMMSAISECLCCRLTACPRVQRPSRSPSKAFNQHLDHHPVALAAIVAPAPSSVRQTADRRHPPPSIQSGSARSRPATVPWHARSNCG